MRCRASSYLRTHKKNTDEILFSRADGTDVQHITNFGELGGAKVQRPIWSPDGTKILFASDHDGDFEIELIETFP